eukprot:1282488-Prymnesium_polylepis.2
MRVAAGLVNARGALLAACDEIHVSSKSVSSRPPLDVQAWPFCSSPSILQSWAFWRRASSPQCRRRHRRVRPGLRSLRGSAFCE